MEYPVPHAPPCDCLVSGPMHVTTVFTSALAGIAATGRCSCHAHARGSPRGGAGVQGDPGVKGLARGVGLVLVATGLLVLRRGTAGGAQQPGGEAARV